MAVSLSCGGASREPSFLHFECYGTPGINYPKEKEKGEGKSIQNFVAFHSSIEPIWGDKMGFGQCWSGGIELGRGKTDAEVSQCLKIAALKDGGGMFFENEMRQNGWMDGWGDVNDVNQSNWVGKGHFGIYKK
jgi:hypothetical protein